MTPEALVLAATAHPSGGEAVAFWVLAPIAVLAAFGLVFARSAVHAALLLAVDMLSLAVFYATQDAPFLAVVQVVVYTGAVLMLFLFVLMLIGVDSSDSLVETLRGQRVVGFLLGLGFVVLVLAGMAAAVHDLKPAGLSAATAGKGNVVAIAEILFSRYVFAFEATSALLITAGLAAMVFAHQERIGPKLTQKERMHRRFTTGGRPSPLPGPGVYADHDAVDTPGLLPDGSIAPGSVPDYLQVSAARPHTAEVEKELER